MLQSHTKIISTFLLSLSVLSACAESDSEDAMPVVDYFSDIGYGEGVAVVQHPAGVHRDGVTYVAFQGLKEDPHVAAYDHDEEKWYGPYKAGDSILGKDPTKKIDSHGKPTMLIDDAGYIHIFYGGHGGSRALHGENALGNFGSGENKHSVSENPLDISSWIDLDNIAPFGTYNQAIKMDNGDIYLFYRHGAHRSDWVYQKSTDNGRTFEDPVSFLKYKRRDDAPLVDSWYAYVSKGLNDEIVVGFDYHYCWDKDAPRNNRGGHSTERKNLYFMTFNTADNTWRNVEGEALKIPLVKEEADEKALAVDTGDLWTFNGTTKIDKDGNPHISAYVGEDIGWQIGGPKHARYFRWTGSEWAGSFDSGLPIGRGDFLVSGDQVRFFLSGVDPNEDETIVRWWESDDGGMSFEKGEELLRFGEYAIAEGEETNEARPKALSNLDSPGSAASAFILYAHPDARMIIAEKPDGTDMRRMYLVGDSGPIVREASDTSD